MLLQQLQTNQLLMLLACPCICRHCIAAADICAALLQETWGHVEFKFTQHKGTDVFLVKMAEEDFEALEDNQVLVQVWLLPHISG